jgi:hypothetical protein
MIHSVKVAASRSSLLPPGPPTSTTVMETPSTVMLPLGTR